MIVATNLTDLHAEPSFLAEMLTQVTNGVALEILEARDKWCRVRQSDGYEGWAYRLYLADAPAPKATHLVVAPAANLYSEMSQTNDPITRLPVGTAIALVEDRHAWARVHPAGDMLRGGWVVKNVLRATASLPLAIDLARMQIVADARRLTGVYYLWGGCTAWGLDCSGLAQLAHRLAGYTIPRDTKLQLPAGKVVEPPYRAGDLLFFHSDTDKNRIGHVGISTGAGGGWKIIHSSRTRNGVYEEDVQEVAHLRDTFAGARTFLET